MNIKRVPTDDAVMPVEMENNTNVLAKQTNKNKEKHKELLLFTNGERGCSVDRKNFKHVPNAHFNCHKFIHSFE